MIKDYFLILQVHYLATDDIIKASYKKLCQGNHPDIGGSITKFQDIQEAYDVLIDKNKKDSYIKQWMKQYIHEENFHLNELKDSFYDITLFHIKKILIAYLESIRDGDYEKAYDYISDRNKKHLFLKDFVNWQKSISEVHHILDFNCFIKNVHSSEVHHPEIWFKVRVKEYNQLLNRVEEDYFDRVLIFEDNQWKVKLKNLDVKSVIRKYKKITTLNKKNKKQFHKLLPTIEEERLTKLVSKKHFISNCDYELLRYKRYKNVFSILAVTVEKNSDQDLLEKIIARETRGMDSFCLYSKTRYYILMPETKKTSGSTVANKISRAVREHNMINLKFKISQINDQYASIKEMLDRLK